MHRFTGLCLAALALTPLAQAGIYVGNPGSRAVGVRLEPADQMLVEGYAWLDHVEVEDCGGQIVDVVVDDAVDPVAGVQVNVDGLSDVCGATWHWASALEANEPDGFVGLVVDEPTTHLDADLPVQHVQGAELVGWSN